MADEQPSFMDKFNMPVGALWANYKWFLIVFGILILIYKFRQVIIDLLISGARQTVSDARDKDAKLKSDETQANNQANQLRNQADDLNNNKPKVDEDWNKPK